jgi:predicted NBD/HSP70 family sugar kinase
MSSDGGSERPSTYPVASIGLTRDVNRAAIFRMIGADGPIARATIARRLNLSPATVTAVTRELLQQGLVRVTDRSQARRGRPAMLLEVVGDAARALGVKVAPDHVVGVSVDLEAAIVERHEAAFDASAEDAVARLGDILDDWTADVPSSPLLGVGLGVSGVVDPVRGTVDSPLLGWVGVPLAAALRERLRVPVVVDNDVNTLAVAERLYGRGRGSEHFLTVTIGRGIGLGVIADGDIYRGHRGGAGEFGHTTAVVDGPLCTCGKRGCLEAVAADPALVAEARRARVLKRGEGIERLRSLADRGSPRACAIFGRAGTALGRAVADLVTILAPEIVLVSGEGTQAWPHLAGAFEEELRATVFGPLQGVRVEVDPWDDAKWAVGAATLVLRASFAAPFDHPPLPVDLQEVVA